METQQHMASSNGCCNMNEKNLFYEQLKNVLISFQDVSLIPSKCYVFYDMAGGKYYVQHKHYNTFISTYLTLNKHNHLTMDLNRAYQHAVMFDIDGNLSPGSIDNYLDNILIPVLKDIFNTSFSILVTQKLNSSRSGLHVYLPDFKISNDDYEWLCSLLKPLLKYNISNENVTLDFPRNFNLPFACKLNDSLYEPSTLILINEWDDKPLKLRLSAANSNLDVVKKIFGKVPKKTSLKNLAFTHYLFQIPQMRHVILGRLMSPINCYHALSVRSVYFTTAIKEELIDDDINIHCVASFQYLDEVEVLKHVYKDARVTFTQSTDLHHYFDTQTFRISQLESSLYSIKQWWNSKRTIENKNEVEKDIFHDLNLKLKCDSKCIREEEHPIKSLLVFENGKFFMPAFYALCNVTAEYVTFKALCEALLALLGPEHTLLKRVSLFNENLVKILCEKYSYQTILYCVGNMHRPVCDLLSKIKLIVENEISDIEKNILLDKIVELICKIIKTHFPIHRNEKDKKFIWNPIHGKWLLVNREDDIKCILQMIIDCFLIYYRESHNNECDYKSSEIRDKCHAYLTSETFMENIYLNLDFRYWLLRTNEGCFDLLSLSISGIVPEQYLSDKTFLPKFSNISKCLNDASLRQTYKLLWTKTFFENYVSRLKSEDDDYMSTLKRLTIPTGGSDALLHAYTHLCKYLRFNFEEMKYFLHVLATTMIATNYGKFLFILQGVKNNGKSKLFNIIRHVLGDYLGVVDNECLSLSRKSETRPALAKNIYTCRLVAVEEFAGSINENLIKNITGNCVVSARNLYESHIAGIPTAKFLVATNKPPAILVTEAFKERVFVFNFSAKFISNLSLSIAEQIESGQFKIILDETNLNETALGFFLHMSFLLDENVSLEDGFLHYPPIPISLTTFKEDYLKITNAYFQFKIYMDIQVIKDELTSESELKSAIRHFLRSTKTNICIDEKELYDQFNLEFKEHIFYPEEQIPLSDSEDEIDEDDDELLRQTQAKKMKKNPPNKSNLCYRDIIIKNLKKKY